MTCRAGNVSGSVRFWNSFWSKYSSETLKQGISEQFVLGCRSHLTRLSLQFAYDSPCYVREHKSRDPADRKSVIHQLENARTREQMLDAINAFRAWLEAEDLLFPTD